MKFTTALQGAAMFIAASQISAFPTEVVKRQAAVTDAQVLNFALTLEYLEATFYTEYLHSHSQSAFEHAGLPPWVRGRFEQIKSHEDTHVEFLKAALGADAVEPCEYNFGHMGPKEFAAFADMLETVGTSAYTGAAALITNKDYLTAAATILATEARHTAWINSAVGKGAPWSTPFEAPLDVNQVYTIASGVITSCPAGNAAKLPAGLKAFPALTLSGTNAPGKKATLSVKASTFSATSGPYFAAFISGLDTVFVPLDGRPYKDTKDGSYKWEVEVPKNLYGVVFALITSDGSKVTDADTLAGPVFMNYEFSSYFVAQ